MNRACGAPWVSKSTHPRKFGNHVTVHRPPVCPFVTFRARNQIFKSKYKERARVLASKLLHFVLLTDGLIMLDIKPTETSILHVNDNSFMGPLIIRAFEKRAPGRLILHTYCTSML